MGFPKDHLREPKRKAKNCRPPYLIMTRKEYARLVKTLKRKKTRNQKEKKEEL